MGEMQGRVQNLSNSGWEETEEVTETSLRLRKTSQGRNSCSNIPGNSKWPWSSESKPCNKTKDISSLWRTGPVCEEILKGTDLSINARGP